MDGTYQSPLIASPGVAAPAGNGYFFIGTDGRLYVVTPASATALPVGNELFATQADLTPSAAVTAALFSALLVGVFTCKISASAGSGAWIANYTLPDTNVIAGALALVQVALPASANPTIKFYDNSTGGTLLSTVTSPKPSATTTWYGVFKFGTDGHWHLHQFEYAITTDNTLGGTTASDLVSPSEKAVRDYVAGRTVQSTQALSGAVIDWSTGYFFSMTLGANTTFTFLNATDGETIVVALTNTASNYTVAWPSVKWVAATAPTMTTGAKTDIYTFVKIGSAIYGSALQNLS